MVLSNDAHYKTNGSGQRPKILCVGLSKALLQKIIFGSCSSFEASLGLPRATGMLSKPRAEIREQPGLAQQPHEGLRGLPMQGGDCAVALQQFIWVRIKYFSHEAICLKPKEPDCAEAENVFAFKPKQHGFFPKTQPGVILLHDERSIIRAVKGRLQTRWVPAVTTLSPALVGSQRPPVLSGSCWKLPWCSWGSPWPIPAGAAAGVSNALSVPRECMKYFEEKAGRNSTMAQREQTAWLRLCWKGSARSGAEKRFRWKEEDFEQLGMKILLSGKVQKDPVVEVRKTEPKLSWKGRTKSKMLLLSQSREGHWGALGSWALVDPIHWLLTSGWSALTHSAQRVAVCFILSFRWTNHSEEGWMTRWTISGSARGLDWNTADLAPSGQSQACRRN